MELRPGNQPVLHSRHLRVEDGIKGKAAKPAPVLQAHFKLASQDCLCHTNIPDPHQCARSTLVNQVCSNTRSLLICHMTLLNHIYTIVSYLHQCARFTPVYHTHLNFGSTPVHQLHLASHIYPSCIKAFGPYQCPISASL